MGLQSLEILALIKESLYDNFFCLCFTQPRIYCGLTGKKFSDLATRNISIVRKKERKKKERRHTNKQIDKQTNRQTDRQTNKQTNKHKRTHTQMAQSLVTTKSEALVGLQQFVNSLSSQAARIDLESEIDHSEILLTKSDLSKLIDPLLFILRSGNKLDAKYGVPECGVRKK
jgi:hypothetical protein